MKKLFISVPMRNRTEYAIKASMEQMHKIAEAVFGEGADEEEATIALLAYENHCYPEAIHVHKEMR